jgi:hypothetical protein
MITLIQNSLNRHPSRIVLEHRYGLPSTAFLFYHITAFNERRTEQATNPPTNITCYY